MLISLPALGDVTKIAVQVAAASDPPELTPTLVGALLGLVAALLIQVVVVPAVQAKAKRRERWQAAISEMAALVTVDFERAVSRYRLAASVTVHHPEYREAALQSGSTEAQKQVDEIIRRDDEERSAADDALDELVSRVVRLQGPVLQRLSDEDSHNLINLMMHLRLNTFLLTAELAVHPERATLDRVAELASAAENARSAVEQFISPIAERLTEPRPLRDASSRRFRRLIRPVRRRLTKTRNWLAKRIDVSG